MMRILTGKKWRGGFLDYYRNKNGYRIQVLAWKNLEKLEHVYHTRPKSLRLLVNYFPVVGPVGLFTKTWSRLREERRNDKYLSCGVGKILESPNQKKYPEGTVVGFIATWHPALAERIVLPEKLLIKMEEDHLPASLREALQAGTILYAPLRNIEGTHRWWKEVRAWSIYSGMGISERTRNALEKGLKEELGSTLWPTAERIDVRAASAVSETRGKVSAADPNPPPPARPPKPWYRGGYGRAGKKSGILFGYGNYAKINIIPYTRPFVDTQTVHEIDPTQIYLEQGVQRWDASPLPKEDEVYDVYFVASYNHTHIPITLHALKQNAYVVVEKPVVMDYGELNELEKALRKAGRRLFIGFHKRYGLFNEYALKDLGVTRGEPISYHSIVYELVQPELFWYNWPVSRSTFLSNGCHQVDHFLHLNNFSKPKNADIKLLQDDAVEVWIELENGATFTTTFSEKGSSRVGPRDIVELKVHGKNVRITDAIRYLSEDEHKIIRRARIFKTNSYRDMYRTIGRKIANNEEGDSIESILISSKVMLDLEEKLQRMKKWGNRYQKAKEEFWSYFR